ncbi:signal peptidase II [Catellatospora sp. KI3]|uniref:signal peptidase II n=1 Tax=Catellatospora sp. KI3 TaxID=3041620 RepID=UPI0024826AA6|nr:signal peptidase II [Catellatospora sp. KI3]MDI1464851.1 signal peptidase II [Catellatospora sp. KI3]
MEETRQVEPEHSPRAIGHGRAVAIFAGMASFAVLLDVVTKEIATKQLDPDEPVRLLGGALYLSLTRNSGAAFSLFRDHTWIFPIIAVGVISWILWAARSLRSLPWALALGSIMGGVLGNLLDRIFRAPGTFHGHVVDFLSLFDPYGRTWPIFNVADMALVGGVCLAILLELTGRQRDGSRLTGKEEQKKAAAGDQREAESAGVTSERGSQAWS